MSEDEANATAKPPGQVYTFYSYKGGVGRSMALVNVGVLMALEGHKVLLVDWDLEAPGLETFFIKTVASDLARKPEQTPGILDLLEAQTEKKILPWRTCVLTANFRATSLDIISAGRKTDDYRKRVQQLNWVALFNEHDIGNFLDGLREEWRSTYDFVLIDSRTGITDIGDICNVLMPDAIVAMFVANYQNVEGMKAGIERARTARRRLPVNRNMLMIIPLQGRDESKTEYQLSMEWKDIFEKEFGFLFDEWLPREIASKEALTKLFIPYVPIWSFGERIPVLEGIRELQDPTSIGSAYLRLAALLSNQLDWYAAFQRPDDQDLKSTKIELGTTLREYESLKETAVSSARRSIWRVVTVSGVVGAIAAISGAISSFFFAKDIAKQAPPPTVTYRFCSGEFESRCPQGTIYQFCGFSPQEWAKARCSSSNVNQLSDNPGNKCGYSVVELTCTPIKTN